MAQPCITRVLLVYYTNIHTVCNCTSVPYLCKYYLKCEHNYTYIVIKWGNIFQVVCSIWGGSSLLWHNCNSAWQNWAFQTVLERGRKLVIEQTRLEYVHRSWSAPFVIASVCETQNTWIAGRPTLIQLSYSKELPSNYRVNNEDITESCSPVHHIWDQMASFLSCLRLLQVSNIIA
jgi:hypothetical protein